MSRPCFALSVMLCCMAGPLLILGKAQAQETSLSPSHDPGECIVCPLAHGPLEVYGGYSDYDYNHYWYGNESELSVPADPEVEVADSLAVEPTSDSLNGAAWESAYEDYYADYFFDDAASSAEIDDLDSAAGSSSGSTEEAASTNPATIDTPADVFDEFGWYTDDAAAFDDYFESYEDYEPIDPAASDETDVATREEALLDDISAEQAALEYDVYEEEWFSYDTNATLEDPNTLTTEIDEAYEALSEGLPDALVDDSSAEDAWGDEEEWYREEYGYANETATDEATAEEHVDDIATDALAIGYDDAYDEAMSAAADVVESATAVNPADVDSELPEINDYESFYEFYDDLDSIEPGSRDLESEEAPANAAAGEPFGQVSAAEPEWLTVLVNRMLSPLWQTCDELAANELIPSTKLPISRYESGCAQEWDCELEYWDRPQPEQASVVLNAAETLDELASLLQNAAVILRGLANDQVEEIAQRIEGSSSH